MRNIYLILSLLCCSLVFLPGCDTEAEVLDGGYIEFGGVKLVFQADAADTYKFTLDGDTIRISERRYLPRTKTTALLRAFKNNETTPVLEEEIAIEHRKMVELVQMPGADIVVASAEEEEDPSSGNSTKVRFFYKNIDGLGSSIKIDIYAAFAWGTTFLPDPVASVSVEEGQLSEYVELDLNCVYTEDPDASPMFFSDIFDLENNVQFTDHESIDYNEKGMIPVFGFSSTEEPGYKSPYKFETFQLSTEWDMKMFTPVFNTPW